MGRKGTAPCRIEGCERKELARRMCSMHYTRAARGGDVGEAESRRAPNRTNPNQHCSVDGCFTRMHARGWCPAHLGRWRVYGDPLGVAPTRPCTVDGCSAPAIWTEHVRDRCRDHYVAFVREQVVAGTYPGGVTAPNGYVYHSILKERFAEHRLVMEDMLGRPLYRDEEVHHRNGVRADNRRENLELWSHSQPAGQRVEDKIAWAREFLARYDI